MYSVSFVLNVAFRFFFGDEKKILFVKYSDVAFSLYWNIRFIQLEFFTVIHFDIVGSNFLLNLSLETLKLFDSIHTDTAGLSYKRIRKWKSLWEVAYPP